MSHCWHPLVELIRPVAKSGVECTKQKAAASLSAAAFGCVGVAVKFKEQQALDKDEIPMWSDLSNKQKKDMRALKIASSHLLT